ncbi:MAG: pilus assembly protein N-terminal domain-containing protein [Bryobacteraceae bacterium]
MRVLEFPCQIYMKRAALSWTIALVFAASYPAAAQQPAQAQTPTASQGQQEPANPAEAQDANQASPHQLYVTVGKSLIVNSAAPIERVSVGYNDVAEATAIGLHEVLVNGKGPGETSLIIWQRDGNKLFFDLTVRPNTSDVKAKLQALRRQMNKQIPGQNIDVSFENGTVFLSGTVHDLTSAQRAEAIAATLGKTVNLLYVSVPPPDGEILLNIKFCIVDRTNSSELGLNLISTGAANTIGTVGTQQFSPPKLSTDTTNGTGKTTITLTDALNIFLLRPDLNLGATIRALQARSFFEVLAEPNVLASDGKLASFLAGGEFPYPTLQGGGAGLGSVTIQFREFGVRLNFVPTITPRGTIKLELAPEVSALDFTSGLVFQGFNIPALTVRRVHTEIELEPGQSFAIGGLMDRRTTETFNKIPGIGDIPILGKLFQSRSLNKQNSELLVIATPELVRPMPAGQKLPELTYPRQLPDPISKTPNRTPGLAATGPVPVTPSAPTIPVEQLVESLKGPAVKLQGAGGSGLPDTSTPFQNNLPMTAPATTPSSTGPATPK